LWGCDAAGSCGVLVNMSFERYDKMTNEDHGTGVMDVSDENEK
jgi:hypothetical protein